MYNKIMIISMNEEIINFDQYSNSSSSEKFSPIQ